MKKELIELRETEENLLFQFVIDDILDEKDDAAVLQYMNDVVAYGCVFGVIRSLVHYSDTYSFFDKFYFEIEELRSDWQEISGEVLEIKYNLKDYLALWAYIEVVNELLNELGQ